MYQWLKNALVFVPVAAAHRLSQPSALGAATLAFLAFSLCASSIYLLNDLCDVAADRHHPRKCRRPIAAGELPLRWAALLSMALLALALALAWPLGAATAAVLAGYFALMVLYTLRLKGIVLLDAMILAGGYTLRVVVGALAVQVWPSAWLFAFCLFLFFSLALVKRYAELSALQGLDGAATHARAYRLQDQSFISSLGIGCGIAAVLVLALYTSSSLTPHHRHVRVLWLTCILLLYWIGDLWLAAHRGRMTDDPLIFALTDRVSQTLVGLLAITAWVAA